MFIEIAGSIFNISQIKKISIENSFFLVEDLSGNPLYNWDYGTPEEAIAERIIWERALRTAGVLM